MASYTTTDLTIERMFNITNGSITNESTIEPGFNITNCRHPYRWTGARVWFIFTVSFIIILVGTIGNTVTYCVLLRKAYKDNIMASALRCLALLDNLILWTVALQINIKFAFNYNIADESLNACQLTEFIKYFLTSVDYWLLVLITLTRLIFLRCPFNANSICSKLHYYSMFLLIILLSGGIHGGVTLFLVLRDAYSHVPTHKFSHCYFWLAKEDVDSVFTFLISITWNFVGPGVLLATFNLMINRSLKDMEARHRQLRSQGIASSSANRGSTSPNETQNALDSGPGLKEPAALRRGYGLLGDGDDMLGGGTPVPILGQAAAHRGHTFLVGGAHGEYDLLERAGTREAQKSRVDGVSPEIADKYYDQRQNGRFCFSCVLENDTNYGFGRDFTQNSRLSANDHPAAGLRNSGPSTNTTFYDQANPTRSRINSNVTSRSKGTSGSGRNQRGSGSLDSVTGTPKSTLKVGWRLAPGTGSGSSGASTRLGNSRMWIHRVSVAVNRPVNIERESSDDHPSLVRPGVRSQGRSSSDKGSNSTSRGSNKSSLPKEKESRDKSRGSRVSGLTRLLNIASTVFICSNLPYWVFHVAFNKSGGLKVMDCETSELLVDCFFLLRFSNHSVNFIFYCAVGSRFRQEFCKWLVSEPDVSTGAPRSIPKGFLSRTISRRLQK